MSPARGPRPFVITTDAAFTEKGVWLIEIQLRLTTTAEPISVILDKARPALTQGIVIEALRGRSLGAKSIRVHLETGKHVTDFVLPESFLHSQTLD